MTHIYSGPDTRWGLLRGTPVRIHKRRGELATEVVRISDNRRFIVGTHELTENRNVPKRTHTSSGKKRQKKGGRKK